MARPFTARRARVAGLASALLLGLVACADARPPSPAPAAATPIAGGGADQVAIRTFQFLPASLEVTAGTTVTWTNRDDILHTVTAGAPGAIDGRFTGTLDGTDTVFQFTFAEPGTYGYFCSRHEAMRGEVRVR